MVKYTCKVGKKIIARDGGLCVKPNGDCTPLYWHLMECNDCYELRQEPQPAAVSGKPQSTCICGNPLGIIGVAGEPYYFHVSDGIMVYDHVAQPVAPAQPMSGLFVVDIEKVSDYFADHMPECFWKEIAASPARAISMLKTAEAYSMQQNAALREELNHERANNMRLHASMKIANQKFMDEQDLRRAAEAELAKAREELERLHKFLKNAREDSEKWYLAYQEAVAEVMRLQALAALQEGE